MTLNEAEHFSEGGLLHNTGNWRWIDDSSLHSYMGEYANIMWPNSTSHV